MCIGCADETRSLSKITSESKSERVEPSAVQLLSVQLLSVCIGRSDETRSLAEITAERVSPSAVNVFNLFRCVQAAQMKQDL